MATPVCSATDDDVKGLWTDIGTARSFNRLKQIATDVCNSAIGNAEFYDHAKTEQWNSSIISSMLKAVISESTPQGASAPSFKFACNSTIVQHLVPTSSLNKARGGTDVKTEEPHISNEHRGHGHGRQAARRATRHAQRHGCVLGREEGRHVDVQVRRRRGQGHGRGHYAHLGCHLMRAAAAAAAVSGLPRIAFDRYILAGFLPLQESTAFQELRRGQNVPPIGLDG
ncbi:hypothetical protein ACCO45_005976 [Purpureocillium lilacinum]|uniref:Uncharacterized protein n=1 Tax=Purpureocillium lilacinum TaxID=33203 RepID=A0ACC4DWY6_PURLI